MRWGIAEINPVQASEPPVPKKKEGIALSVEQREQLIAGYGTVGMDVFLELDAANGGRRGELAGLQWNDLHGKYCDPGASGPFEGEPLTLSVGPRTFG
jgi:hypothetical protein